MKTKKDYHKQPHISVRLESADEKRRLDDFSKSKRVSISWIIKRGLDYFWDAYKNGHIKI